MVSLTVFFIHFQVDGRGVNQAPVPREIISFQEDKYRLFETFTTGDMAGRKAATRFLWLQMGKRLLFFPCPGLKTIKKEVFEIHRVSGNSGVLAER
jgi:hypothetical protein